MQNIISKFHGRHVQITQSLSQRHRRIYLFLVYTPVGVLSTTDPNGEPHGVVIYFNIDDTFTITFLTRKGTKKYDNLIHNNHVMLTVFDAASQTTVQVSGEAYEITGRDDLEKTVKNILVKNRQLQGKGLMPIAKLQAGEFTAFRIRPAQMRMAIYTHAQPGDYGELFESVESFDLRD